VKLDKILEQENGRSFFSAKIYPSKRLAAMVLLSYLIATMSLLLLAFHCVLFFLIIPALWLHGYKVLQQDCLRCTPGSIVYIEHISGQIWQLSNRAGDWFWVRQSGPAYRAFWIMTLRLECLLSHQRFLVVILKDAMLLEDRARLLSILWH